MKKVFTNKSIFLELLLARANLVTYRYSAQSLELAWRDWSATTWKPVFSWKAMILGVSVTARYGMRKKLCNPLLHLGRFTHLVELMEMTVEPPSLDFRTIAETQGLQFA